MMSVAEDVWDQVSRLDNFKEGRYVQDKVKNSLCSFTYNYIDFDLKEFKLGRSQTAVQPASIIGGANIHISQGAYVTIQSLWAFLEENKPPIQKC